MQTLAARINDTVEKFRADPTAAVASPSVTATLLNGHARLSSGPFNWESDLGPTVGGENLAPSPTAYLLGALAGCGVVFMRDTLAPLFDVTLDDVQATASCSSDAAGLLGIQGRDPALEDLALTIRVSSPDPAERLEPMFAAWRERCPIFLTLRNANPVALDIQATGRTKE
jgi:uncharacterized OsmC-like protein